MKDKVLLSLQENSNTLEELATEVNRLDEAYKKEYSAILAGGKHALKALRTEAEAQHQLALDKALKNHGAYKFSLLEDFQEAGIEDNSLLERVKKLDHTGDTLFKGLAKGLNRNINWLITEHKALISLLKGS